MLIKDISDCRSFAVRLSRAVVPDVLADGLCIGLEGELGAGKTTLVRFIAEALSCADPVSSPSYVLQNLYQAEQAIIISHWDLYRLKQQELPEDLHESMQPGTLTLIEWPGRCAELGGMLDLLISIRIIDQDSREMLIEGISAKGCELITE